MPSAFSWPKAVRFALRRQLTLALGIFTGTAECKTEIPTGVYDLSGLIAHLRAQTAEVMSLNRMQFCVGRLETAGFLRHGVAGRAGLDQRSARPGRVGASDAGGAGQGQGARAAAVFGLTSPRPPRAWRLHACAPGGGVGSGVLRSREGGSVWGLLWGRSGPDFRLPDGAFSARART